MSLDIANSPPGGKILLVENHWPSSLAFHNQTYRPAAGYLLYTLAIA